MKRINQIKSLLGDRELRELRGDRALQALSEPIICLGPGGDFVTQIVADEMGEMIFVSQNSGDATGQNLSFVEQPIDWLERLFGIGARLVGHTVQESPLQENPLHINSRGFTDSISTKQNVTTPSRALGMIGDGMFRKGRSRTAPPPTVYVYRRVAETLSESQVSIQTNDTQRMNLQNESDTQTNADLQLRSPIQSNERLLPDSAGNCGRTRREQSHRVRTCGVSRRERRSETQPEQGSLFI